MNNRVRIYYHSADADGKLSGFLMKWAIEENIIKMDRRFEKIEMVPFNYNFSIFWDSIHVDDIVFWLDVSAKPEEMEDMYDIINGKMIWIDHHSSIEETHSNVHLKCPGIRNFKKAACQNVYDFLATKGTFTPEQENIFKNMKSFVDIVGTLDIWDKSVVNSEDEWELDYLSITYALNSLTTDPSTDIGIKFWKSFIGECIDGTVSELIEDLREDGRVILSYVNIRNRDLCRSYGFSAQLEGLNVFALNQGIAGGHTFRCVNGNYDAFVSFVKSGKKNNYSVSVYTNDNDIDLNDKLGHIGFKGHPGAGGFRCDNFKVTDDGNLKTINIVNNE